MLQLLFKHWSTLRMWYKEAPLDLIRHYFGPEVAFYFGWLEFYNIFLAPMAILGLLVTIVNILVVKYLYIWEM